jgi:hypothetical protein
VVAPSVDSKPLDPVAHIADHFVTRHNGNRAVVEVEQARAVKLGRKCGAELDALEDTLSK